MNARDVLRDLITVPGSLAMLKPAEFAPRRLRAINEAIEIILQSSSADDFICDLEKARATCTDPARALYFARVLGNVRKAASMI